MKFAIFYEITVPRKWGPDAEARIFHEVVEQVQFAEEMGFIGAVALLALYLLTLLFITYMALRCRSTFPRLVAAGMGLCLFTYVFINVAMVTGLVPVVGVPLPLVSYGGTSMLTMMVGLGFVLNAHVNRDVRLRREELGPFW